ncbi:hypothetical protein MNBD_GAMMA07-752 [hydrothermal vent metagenome]|uniref:Uncharacterized protein n=1 Tax=hydrothermal vent metagenome TaxID=652676 RepID=A0A3B0WTD4_9ZZZZ
MNNNKMLNKGDRVRIISTGQEVTIDQVSAYGFSIIKFKSGGTYNLLNHKFKSTINLNNHSKPYEIER